MTVAAPAAEEGEEAVTESAIPAATPVSVEALSLSAPYVLYPHDDKIYLCDGDDPARGFVVEDGSDEALAAVLTACKGDFVNSALVIGISVNRSKCSNRFPGRCS